MIKNIEEMISTYWESGNSRLIAYNSFVNMLPLKKKDYLTEWENLLKIKSEKMKNGGSRMKLIELKIRNFGCIDEKGIRIKIDNIVVLIGPNNVGKTTVLKAYEVFKNSGSALTIDDFYQNNENNPVEIEGVFGEITEDDKTQIGEKWLYQNEDGETVITYKWKWNKSGVKGEKYSWNNDERKWIRGGMGGWDAKIASCIPVPLKISPFDDSVQLEKKIVELLTSAVKDNIKNNQSKITEMLDQINDLAKNVKTEIADELNKTTNKLEASGMIVGKTPCLWLKFYIEKAT